MSICSVLGISTLSSRTPNPAAKTLAEYLPAASPRNETCPFPELVCTETGAPPPSRSSTTWAPGTTAPCGSTILTRKLLTGSSPARTADGTRNVPKRQNETNTRKLRILVLLHAKRVAMDGARGLLARRVRAVSARLPRSAFPGLHPVTCRLVLAHSCAAARDSHPLPILITRPVAPGDKNARTD